MNDSRIDSELSQLFDARYHGAGNIKGIKYQIMYSVLLGLSLFQEGPEGSIQLEGIEDIDIAGAKHIQLAGIKVVNRYVQVETSKHAWDWGKFADSKIINRFLPVWLADSTAQLSVVTNFSYAGKLDELAKFCNRRRPTLSNKTVELIKNLCRIAGFPNINVMQLIRSVSFLHLPDEELEKQINAAIVKSFELTQGNIALYFLSLMAKFFDMASRREAVHLKDLESIKLFVSDQIAAGPINPAIQNGWVEPLRFNKEEHPGDYYIGKNARPGHILSGLDIPRPAWEARIDEALRRSRVCVIRGASGQGKSTLLYRYAYNHYQPETTFIVKRLSDEDMIDPVGQVIATRQRLGLPILILIDNVGYSLRLWHKLVAEFSGQEVCFLITVREEDWYRYSGGASGFTWEIVTPELSLTEARLIFAGFKNQGKVAPGIPTPDWAFAQIAERKLLIEFTYLITHGQMLADRLQEQVHEMIKLTEDRGKLQVLRLVSVAQAFGARIKIESILANVSFERDADATLQSLEGEYLLFTDGVCEGLHLIRSEHLIPLLHRAVSIERTVIDLIRVLDMENLKPFINNVLIEPRLKGADLVMVLVDRFKGADIRILNQMCEALFTASETLYHNLHRSYFDAAFERAGNSGIFLLSFATIPFRTVNILESLKTIFPDNPNTTVTSELADQFNPRDWEERYETKFLRGVIAIVDREQILAEVSQIGPLLGWCRVTRTDPSRILQFVSIHDWREKLYQVDLTSASNLLITLHDFLPEKYDDLLLSDKHDLMSYFKLLADTLLVEERSKDIYIEFVADQEEEQLSPHDQTLSRLRHLRNFFPKYDRYCSQGLYAASHGLKLPIYQTEKAIPAETLQLEEHAGLNGTYLKIIQSYYTAQSLYEWEQLWFATRDSLLEFVEKCIQFYENVSKRNLPDIAPLDASLKRAAERAVHTKSLPGSMAETFTKEQEVLEDWVGSLRNFLVQFSEHDPNDANHKSSVLMRHNLKDAIKKMFEMHNNFDEIVSKTLAYFDFQSLNDRENRNYAYLSDILDYIFAMPGIETHNLRATIDKFRKDQRQHFAEAVLSTVRPLEEQGFSFVYPKGPLLDHPLLGIVVAFEVDFELLIDQILLIGKQLAAFPLQCDFVYFVPLLKGHYYSRTVLRIAFPNVVDIARGKLEDKNWPLLPVEPPPGLYELLEGVKETSLAEDDMKSQFYSIFGRLNTVRNAIYFVKSKLNATQRFEAELEGKYLHSMHSKLELARKQVNAFSAVVLGFSETGAAENEWKTFSHACMDRLKKAVEQIEQLDIKHFYPTNLQEVEIEMRFASYLNRKYLS